MATLDDLNNLVAERQNLDADLEICVRQLLQAVKIGSTKAIRGEAISKFEDFYKEMNTKRSEVQRQIDKLVLILTTAKSSDATWPPVWSHQEDLMDLEAIDKQYEKTLEWFDHDLLRQRIDEKKDRVTANTGKFQ